ncbi:MAG TPA: hypothetical protein VGY57_16300 [Vicinamibacterales bacterium]|nr:hypothetical protein [Vicinamibacterales bacterium]
MRIMLPAAALIASLSGATAFAEPIVVSCGAGQRAIVHDTFVRGERVTNVSCTGAPTYRAARYTYHRAHRSWGKTALIIGGSAGTGAGIGGIVAGKKGALIGAALGGGVGSLYEGAHRR